jgi:hypothetical protein
LDRGQRQCGMSAMDCLDTRFGKSPVQNLSLIHQVFDCSGNVFNRHFRVNAMLIEKVYAVGAKPPERSFNDQLDMIRFAVKPPEADAPSADRYSNRTWK